MMVADSDGGLPGCRGHDNGARAHPASPGDEAAKVADPWRPSEYTAMLIHTLATEARHLIRGDVLEIGTGSGTVLAALASLGAARLVGTDIDPAAIDRAGQQMRRAGITAELLSGDLWAPIAGQRFDLIVANAPHFPTTVTYPGRPLHWSRGGADGRRVMDPLLRGLRQHLTEGGHAVIVHSAFLGLAATRTLLAEEGLGLRRIATTLMPLAPEKRAVMTRDILDHAGPDAIRHIGDYTFLVTDILDISALCSGRA